MKRVVLSLSIILLLSLALVACAPQTDTVLVDAPVSTLAPTIAPTLVTVDPSITLTDGLGRSVTLPAPAEKIVSLAASNTEILYAIGAGSQVIGRDEFSDFPEEALALPVIGGSWGGYDLEAITALQPDLVLAAQINTAEQVASLEALGLTVFYLSNPLDLDGLYANLETVGRLAGRETEAAALVDSLRQRADAALAVVATTSERPLVYYELDATDPAKPFTPGPGTFVDMLISLAGGRNLGGSLSSEWAQVSAEEILLQNPDLIILGDSAYGVTAEQVAARPGWDALSAVQENRIFPFNDDLVTLPGPRLVDGLIEFIKIIHPEIADQVE